MQPHLGLSRKAPHSHAGRLYIEYICSLKGQKAMAETPEFVLYPQIAPSFAGADQVPQRTIFMEEPTAEEFKKLQTEIRQIFIEGK